MSQQQIRTEPRTSKAGTVKYTFWDETPLEIRQNLETHAMKWFPETGDYTYTAKDNSSGGLTVFWNDRKEQEITGQQLPDKPRRFTRSSSGTQQQTDWAERDAKKSEQIQKLHDETLVATREQTDVIKQFGYHFVEAVNELTAATNRNTESRDNLRRQVEDLCFILGEQNKAKGGTQK